MVSYSDTATDVRASSDDATLAKDGSVSHLGEMPDARPIADHGGCVDVRGVGYAADQRIFHPKTPERITGLRLATKRYNSPLLCSPEKEQIQPNCGLQVLSRSLPVPTVRSRTSPYDARLAA